MLYEQSLTPNKQQVFGEAFRVLRPGGRVTVSDVVQTAPFPDDVRDDPEALAACVSGAATTNRLEAILEQTGFESVAIASKDDSHSFIREWDEQRDLDEYLVSAVIEAPKSK